MQNVCIINLKSFIDERGTLLPFEYQSNCPFEIKRIFMIYGVPQNMIRGKHINIISQHLLISIKGSCKVKCIDNDEEKIYILDSKNKGLYINRNIYKEMYDFSEDCILMCLTDTRYDEKEYVEKELKTKF